nr:sialidase family protein [uncultured Bdellovibrio sp.]
MIKSTFRTFWGLALFSVMLTSTGCTLEALLEKGESTSKILDDVIPLSITMDVGSSKAIEPSGGVPPFTYKTATSGFLDTSTGLYSIPTNAQLDDEVIEITDSTGKTFAVTVHRKGFREFRKIDMPQSAQDQNFISDAIWLPSGKILATAVGSDNMGERWATYRSSDDGVTWSRVDHFMGFHYNGESHPLAMAVKGSTIFVCGYSYRYDQEPTDPNSGWFVRKSTDEGTTWSTSDAWWENAGSDHVCYDIAVSPATGFIYAVGYADTATGMSWIVRESQNDGATWQTIYQSAGISGWDISAYQIDISPSGDLFVMGKSGSPANMYFLKGTFSGGTWTWTPATTIPAVVNFGDYELRGTLKVVDDNTAYYSCSVGGVGKVYQTLDGGVSWTQAYSGQGLLQGMTRTSSGVFIATGGSRAATPNDWKVVSSSDGISWTALDLDAALAPTKDPYGLTIVADPSSNKVLAFSYNDKGYQSTVAYSPDAGGSWTLRSEVRFEWAFWSTIKKIIRVSPTTLYAILNAGDLDGNWPWVIIKSSDNGVTWQDSDRFTTAGTNPYIEDLIQGHDGALYAVGIKSGNRIIRRSTDGVLWTEVYSVVQNNFNSAYLLTNQTTETYLAYPDGTDVRFMKTTDGVTWNLVQTFALPGGVNEIRVNSLAVDQAGHIYVVLLERMGSTGDVVLYRSVDSGGTWSEVKKSAVQPSFWDMKTVLRMAPSGEIFFRDGIDLFQSTDNGATWNTFSNIPSDILDIGWAAGRTYFMVKDTTHNIAVVTEGDVPGSWIVVESLKQRETVGEIIGEYETDLATTEFISLSPTELLLNYTYNDAYLGARAVFRVLDTSQ